MSELPWTNVDSEVSSGATRSVSKIGLILAGLTGGIGIALSIITIPFVSPALRRICLPYVPATTQQVQNVLQGLRGNAGTVIDLGSGDGRLVLAAAKNGFTACGVELNAWLIAYSKITAYTHGLSSKAVFYRRDLWTVDLSKYDNIILFGVQQMMSEIEEKFLAQLKSDCNIVVCRFPLPNMTPIKTIGCGVDTVWIYKPTLQCTQHCNFVNRI